MKNGRITSDANGESVEVEYELWVTESDDAGGRIRIGDDLMPGNRFMSDPTSALPGNLNYVLVTVNGSRVQIFFENSNGTFVCQVAEEARKALAAGA
jgi:hypothetical protein